MRVGRCLLYSIQNDRHIKTVGTSKIRSLFPYFKVHKIYSKLFYIYSYLS